MNRYLPTLNATYRGFQQQMLHALLLAATVCAGLFVVADWAGWNHLGVEQLWATQIGTLAFLAFYLISRRRADAYPFISSLAILTSLTLFTTALWWVPDDELRVVWFFLGIGVSYLLRGRSAGLLYTLASLVIVLVSNPLLAQPFSNIAVVTLSIALLWASVLFFLYSHHAQLLYSQLTGNEERYRLLIETAIEGIGVVQDGVFKFVNPQLASYLGYSKAELEGQPVLDFVHEADRAMVQERYVGRLRGDPVPPRYEIRALTKRKDVRWYEMSGTRIEWEGRPATLNMLAEITERKRSEDYENFRSRILEMLAASTPLPVTLRAIVTGIEAIDPQMLCAVMQLDDSGKHFARSIAPSLPDFYNAAIVGLEIGIGVGSCGTAAFSGERVIVEDTATHPYWTPYASLTERAGLRACWSQPIRSSSHQILGTFAIYHRAPHTPTEADITLIEKTASLVSIAIERHLTETRVHNMAYYDSLTDLPNRRLLDDRLGQALATSKRSGKHGAVMLLDLDNFKPLNDEHGHALGDLLLVEVAERLIRSVREVDTVARLGGDEFVVVLNGLDADRATSAEQALAIAEKIRQTLSRPYLLNHTQGHDAHLVEHHCSASIGVALFSGQDSNQTELIKQADLAMYQAKENGRNAIHLATRPELV